MHILYLFIYFCLLQFFFFFYSFENTSFSPSWLTLFLGVLLFFALVNGIVFLISDHLLLVYGNAIDFSILILYPATLLNSFLSSYSFWWDFKHFICIIIFYLQTVTAFLLIYVFLINLLLSY